MNSSITMATSGDPRIWTAAAWLRPTSAITMMTPAIVSGTPATAVTRSRKKSAVTDLAVPDPRTIPSGVRMVMTVSSPQTARDDVDEHPQQQRQRDRTEQVGAREPFAFRRTEAVAEVPDKM